ncbi:MAG: zinc-binding dehydrogenase, partial [Promethearchaeota archaeon]
EFVKVYKDDLFHVPESVSFKEAAMVESFAVAVRALKISNIPENQKILIIGGGNIGLTTLNVLLAKRKPNYVLVIEPHDYLREKAIKIGATDALQPSKAKIRKFFKKNNGAPDYIFDCVGNEQTMIMAIDFIRGGGKIVLEGVYRGNISFPISMMLLKEIGLQGIWGHDRDDIIAAIDLVAQKKVNPNELISNIIPLKEIQSGFEEYLKPGERKFVKTLVKI